MHNKIFFFMVLVLIAQSCFAINGIGLKTFIPSAVQFNNKENIKGGCIIGSELLSIAIGGIGWFWNTTEYMRYKDLPRGASQEVFDSKLRSSEFYGTVSIVSFSISGAIYLYSMIDAIWFSHPREKKEEQTIETGLYLIPDKNGITLSSVIRF